MPNNTSSYRDGDMRSAWDIMMAAAELTQPVDFVAGKVISKKNFSGSTRYSYCPFCYQRVRRAGLDYKKELRPLLSVTYKNLYKVDNSGTLKIVFEKTMECTVCRDKQGRPKRITLDDFSQAYSEPYKEDEILYLNINDQDALRRAGFDELAEGL